MVNLLSRHHCVNIKYPFFLEGKVNVDVVLQRSIDFTEETSKAVLTLGVIRTRFIG